MSMDPCSSSKRKTEEEESSSNPAENEEGRNFKFKFNLEEQYESLPLLLIPPNHRHHEYEEEEEVVQKKKKQRIEEEEEEEKKGCRKGDWCTCCAREKRPNTRSLYSLSTNLVHHDQVVTLPYNRYCLGSSFGWLVTFKRKDWQTTNKRKDLITMKVRYYAQLHNPFLDHSNTIPLPPLPLHGLVRPNYRENLARPSIYLRKAVLSSPPDDIHNKNFLVVAILTHFCRLAFFNPAAKATFCWTPIGDWDDWKCFDDVIYSHKAKQFYTVDSLTGIVYSIRGLDHTPYFTQVAPRLRDGNTPWRRYLVESPTGDLLQLCKDEDTSGVGLTFEVFMLQGGRWIQVYNLGDTVLFLGSNASISRSASAFPKATLRPNSIYFTRECCEYFDSHCVPYSAFPHLGIYTMEDGIIHPIISPAVSTCYGPQATTPIWLLPTPHHEE